MSELKPRRARANAFDLARTDRDDVEGTLPVAPLSDLLPRIADRSAGPHAIASPSPSLHQASSKEAVPGSRPSGSPAVTTLTSPLRPVTSPPTPPTGDGLDGASDAEPRGVGGRPARAGVTTTRITSTAARVPIDLYDSAEDLVKGRGKPSWGQLIAWTCTTRQQDVISEVLTQAQPAPGLIPRGQNKRGTASTQITARFTPDEHATFARTRELAQAAADAAEHPIEGPVTATLVVIAALKVAATPA